jgi:hypothetical protein
MTKERFSRVTEARARYLGNIYRTRRSQSDRKAIRGALKQGGEALANAMTAIMDRKYSRATYMGYSVG